MNETQSPSLKSSQVSGADGHELPWQELDDGGDCTLSDHAEPGTVLSLLH